MNLVASFRGFNLALSAMLLAGMALFSAAAPASTVTYTVDPASGQVKKATYPDGSYITYTYDANGNRISAVVTLGVDTSPPTAPANLTATAASSTQIDLSWAASTDNRAVTGYRVERCQGASCNNFSEIAQPTATTYSNTGLTSGVSYSYRVRATDAVPLFSGYSNTATRATSDTTPPSTPGTPTFPAVAATTATANWAASTDNVAVTGYEYSLNSGAWTATGSASASFGLTGLTGSTTYTFAVRARDAAGNNSLPSGNGSFTTSDVTPPTTPGTPTFPAVAATTATANWTASTDNIAVTGYEYSLNGGSWTATGSASASFSLTGLTGSTTYTFAVRARDAAANFSLPSGNGSFTTSDGTSPTIPGTPSFSSITANSALATWAASTDNVGVTGYEYSLNSGAWTATGSASASFTIPSLTPLTAYTFAVRARDAAGNRSGASPNGAFTTTAGSDTTPPTTPGTPTFPAVAATTATANWAASTDNVGVTGYEYSLNSGAWTATGSASASFSLTGLTGSTTYTFAVRARDAAGNNSLPSGNGSFTTSDGTPPTTPGTPTFPAVAVTTATANWTASTDNVAVTGYQYSLNGGTWTATGSASASFSLTGLTGSTTYTFAVRARDAAGNFSLPSGNGSFTTSDGTPPTTPGTPTFPAVAATTATANWTASTDNVGVTGYEYSLNGGAWTATGSASASFSLTGLTGLTTYTFAVRARDAAANYSLPSGNGSFTTTDGTPPSTPGTPTFPAVAVTTATANWAASTDNVAVTGYEYSLNGGAWTATGSASASFSLTGLTGLTTYTLAVRARDAAGNYSLPSGNGSFTTSDGTPPTTPGTPTFPAIAVTTATANWTASTDNVAVTGYDYSLNGGSWTSTGSASASFSLTGLTGSTTYTFAVRARDAAGNNSLPSGNGSFTTTDGTPPTTPGTPTFPAVAATTATANWTASTDNVAVTGYEYSLNGGTWTATGSASASFSLTGLTGSTNYTFAVRARDAAGNNSLPSGNGSFTTSDGTPPGAPGIPVISGIMHNAVTATWTVASDNVGVTSYEWSTNGTAWNNVGTALTATITGLSPNTTYTLQVRAKDAATNTGSPSSVQFTTIAQVTIANLNVTTITTSTGSANAIYQLTNAGDIVTTQPTSSAAIDVGDWLVPKVGMGNYQVFATAVGANCPSGTYGTWIGLGTMPPGPVWAVGVGGPPQTVGCTFDIQIRHSSNPSVILGTARIVLSARNN